MIALRSKLLIQFAAAGLLILGASILLWACATGVTLPAPRRTAAPRTDPRPDLDDPRNDSDTANRWQGVFARRFQRPLFDPPATPLPTKVERVVPPPPIQVVATMPEPGGGSAMIQDDTGKVSVVSVGATVVAGGTSATLIQVQDDEVQLRHEGKTITVKLKKD